MTSSRPRLNIPARLAAGAALVLCVAALGATPATAGALDPVDVVSVVDESSTAGPDDAGCQPGEDGSDVPTCIGEALLIVRPELPLVTQSGCTLGVSDEASGYVVPDTMGVRHTVDGVDVTGQVDVTDGATVTVLASTYLGVQFADGGTELVHELSFDTCAATEPPVAEQPGTDPSLASGPVVETRVLGVSFSREQPAGQVPAATGAATASVAAAASGTAPSAALPAVHSRSTTAHPAATLAATGVEAWHAALAAALAVGAGAALLVASAGPVGSRRLG